MIKLCEDCIKNDVCKYVSVMENMEMEIKNETDNLARLGCNGRVLKDLEGIKREIPQDESIFETAHKILKSTPGLTIVEAIENARKKVQVDRLWERPVIKKTSSCVLEVSFDYVSGDNQFVACVSEATPEGSRIHRLVYDDEAEALYNALINGNRVILK